MLLGVSCVLIGPHVSPRGSCSWGITTLTLSALERRREVFLDTAKWMARPVVLMQHTLAQVRG